MRFVDMSVICFRPSSAVAALLLGLLFVGCAKTSDVEAVNARVDSQAQEIASAKQTVAAGQQKMSADFAAREKAFSDLQASNAQSMATFEAKINDIIAMRQGMTEYAKFQQTVSKVDSDLAALQADYSKKVGDMDQRVQRLQSELELAKTDLEKAIAALKSEVDAGDQTLTKRIHDTNAQLELFQNRVRDRLEDFQKSFDALAKAVDTMFKAQRDMFGDLSERYSQSVRDVAPMMPSETLGNFSPDEMTAKTPAAQP